MADTLKEFSNLTNKSYSHLKTGGSGVTLVTTSGSQQAVIKGISIDNPNSRAIDIRVGSATGTKIASSSASETLSGNEILDNSSSLVAVTTTEPALTSWTNHTPVFDHGGNSSYRGADGWLGFGAVATSGSGLLGKTKRHDMTNVVFTGGTYEPTTAFWTSTPVDIQYANATTNHASDGSNAHMGEVYKGADGKYYGWTNWENSPKRGTIYRWDSDGSNRTALANSDGTNNLNCWDGSRYIYSFRANTDQSHRYFDTNNGGSSATFATKDPDGGTSANSGMRETNGETYRLAYYYCDGYIALSGRSGQNPSSNYSRWPKFVDVTTVTTNQQAKILTINHDHAHMSYNHAGGNPVRNSNAIIKGTNGKYYLVFAWRNNDTNSSADNGFTVWNMGTDISTWMAGGHQTGFTTRFNVPQVVSSGGERNGLMYKCSNRSNAWHGNQFANSSAIADGKLYMFGNRQGTGSGGNGSVGSPYNAMYIDIQHIVENSLTINTQAKAFGTDSDNLTSGAWKAHVEDSAVDAGYGNINFRTTGILVT